MSGRKYENKYVAFLDILGFKNKVEESILNDEVYGNIQKALKEFLAEKENQTKFQIIGENITTFSDNIVMSYPAKDSDNLYYLGKDIVFLQHKLFEYGMLIRGGITKGKIYHTKDIVFGPALNAAYELESKYSVYPRVILDKILYDEKIKSFDDYLGVENDIKIFKSTFAVESLTNLVYVDTLNCASDLEFDYYLCYLNKVKEFIESNLETVTAKEVRAKYIWLANYYNKTIYNQRKTINSKKYIINKRLIKF